MEPTDGPNDSVAKILSQIESLVRQLGDQSSDAVYLVEKLVYKYKLESVVEKSLH